MKSKEHEDAVQAVCAVDIGSLEEEGGVEASIRALREAIERLRDLALSPH
jgi:hypothetical protein